MAKSESTGGGLSAGSRLALVREQLGLTRAQAAERTGVSVGYWSDLEADRKAASLEKLHQVAGQLGVDPSALDSRLASSGASASADAAERRALDIARSLLKNALRAAAEAGERAAFEALGGGVEGDVEG